METVSTLYTEMMDSLIRPPTRLGNYHSNIFLQVM